MTDEHFCCEWHCYSGAGTEPRSDSIVDQAVVLGILSVHSVWWIVLARRWQICPGALFCWRPNLFRSFRAFRALRRCCWIHCVPEGFSSSCCLQAFMLSVSQNGLMLGQGGPLGHHIRAGQRQLFGSPFFLLCSCHCGVSRRQLIYKLQVTLPPSR